MTETRFSTRRAAFVGGMRDTIPMVVGATPFGIIFGAFAVTQAGLSFWGAMGFSLFVFAGSAQFIGATLLAQGTGIGIIVLTTFIVNVRHALYGASLAPYMKHLSQRWLLPLAFWLTDETYATVVADWSKSKDPQPNLEWYHFGSSILMYVNWNFWTLIGVLFGSRFENAANWGLDFAMVVTFIGIVVPLLVNRPMIVCAVVAGVAGVIFNGLDNNLGLLVASVLAIAAGYLAEEYTRRSEPKLVQTKAPITDTGGES
ncbi:MAG: AzlC family ABC transporter permease [Chloroflexota bacterium]